MKIKLSIYTVLTTITLMSCHHKATIDGNHSICYNEEYSEVYFKQDSMRIASDNDWVKLSEWRKFEFKNDTLKFETFGEWREPMMARMEYIDEGKIRMSFIDTDEVLYLESIDENLNFEKLEEFWAAFHDRQNESQCN